MYSCGTKWVIVEYGGGWCVSICLINCLCVYKCGGMWWCFSLDFIHTYHVAVKHIFIDILLTFRFNRWHVAHNVLWYRRYNVHFQRPSNRCACRSIRRRMLSRAVGCGCPRRPSDNGLLTPDMLSHIVAMSREYINKNTSNISHLVSVCLIGRGLCDKDCHI